MSSPPLPEPLTPSLPESASPAAPPENALQIYRATFIHPFEPEGQAVNVPADTSLLQSAESAGLQPESSCRNGTCRSCICQLLSGQVTYRIAWPGLSPDEKREGYILPCVAYPASDVVVRLAV